MSTRTFQNIVFKDCGPKLSLDKVAEFEKRIGFALPEDFRRFLCEINGGVSDKQGFQCVGDSPLKPRRDYEEKCVNGSRKKTCSADKNGS